MSNHYYDAIINILTPLLGKSMTETSVRLQCGKLGIMEDTITKNHLNDLSQRLFPGLKTFLGIDKANQVADLIKNVK